MWGSLVGGERLGIGEGEGGWRGFGWMRAWFLRYRVHWFLIIPPPSVSVRFARRKRKVETRNIAAKNEEQKIENFMKNFVGTVRS